MKLNDVGNEHEQKHTYNEVIKASKFIIDFLQHRDNEVKRLLNEYMPTHYVTLNHAHLRVGYKNWMLELNLHEEDEPDYIYINYGDENFYIYAVDDKKVAGVWNSSELYDLFTDYHWNTEIDVDCTIGQILQNFFDFCDIMGEAGS